LYFKNGIVNINLEKSKKEINIIMGILNIFSKFSKVEKILLILGFIFIVATGGISIIYYITINKCERELIEIIKQNRDYYYNSAIYLINSIDSFCRPCAKYNQLRNDLSIKIIFLVDPDYSDNDIENFRKFLNIDNKDEIRRMDIKWKEWYLKCNKNKWNFFFNFLILINEGRIIEIRRF